MNDAISAFLSERIAANDFPSAVYLVAEKGVIVFHDALGNAVVTPEVIPAKLDTIYDLASLTKPLVTGLLAASQIENGEFWLATEIGDLVPVDANSYVAGLPVADLAAHISGLPAWLPLYLQAKSPQPNDLVELISHLEGSGRGITVEYSDLNFISLALSVEGNRPDSDFEHWVSKELGLKKTSFTPLKKGVNRIDIAASELGNEFEKQICIERGYLRDKNPVAIAPGSDSEPPEGRTPNAFRNYQIWGEVHDGNAYFMGGVAGHAGLFSTAEEVFKIALQFLPQYTQLLKPETCELFRTNFTKGLNEDRSFAFQLASTKDSTAGTKMSRTSFGHNGFTGTSFWIDPVKDRIFVLLTNRTHNHPLPFVNINSVRRRFHDIAIEELDGRNK